MYYIRSLYHDVQGGFLKLRKTRFEDDGIYICLAINKLETLTTSTQIKVKGMLKDCLLSVCNVFNVLITMHQNFCTT